MGRGACRVWPVWHGARWALPRVTHRPHPRVPRMKGAKRGPTVTSCMGDACELISVYCAMSTNMMLRGGRGRGGRHGWRSHGPAPAPVTRSLHFAARAHVTLSKDSTYTPPLASRDTTRSGSMARTCAGVQGVTSKVCFGSG
jgi:hypothetical protein